SNPSWRPTSTRSRSAVPICSAVASTGFVSAPPIGPALEPLSEGAQPASESATATAESATVQRIGVYSPSPRGRTPETSCRAASTRLGGAISAYASSTIPASSSQSRPRSRRTPSHPRWPTYGGTKNRSPSASTSIDCMPSGAAHQIANRPSPWWFVSTITNARLPRTKNVGAPTWRLEIGGRVSQPLSLSLDELRARPARTLAVTLECAGNGRVLMSPRSVSQPWLQEAVGTAEWTGTPLAPILHEAGLLD